MPSSSRPAGSSAASRFSLWLQKETGAVIVPVAYSGYDEAEREMLSTFQMPPELVVQFADVEPFVVHTDRSDQDEGAHVEAGAGSQGREIGGGRSHVLRRLPWMAGGDEPGGGWRDLFGARATTARWRSAPGPDGDLERDAFRSISKERSYRPSRRWPTPSKPRTSTHRRTLAGSRTCPSS